MHVAVSRASEDYEKPRQGSKRPCRWKILKAVAAKV